MSPKRTAPGSWSPAASKCPRIATERTRLSMPSYSASTSSSSSSEPDDWEDVLATPLPPPSNTTTPLPTGNLELILDRAPGSTGPQRKKGASAEERRIRMLTHCMHVQFLVFHGAVRNHWCNDAETQAVLLSLVPPGILKDFDRARERQSASEENAVRKERKGKKREGGGEKGEPERSGLSDPLIKPLGTLLHWWKKKFVVDTPGLRKRGYKTLQQFQGEAQEEKQTRYRFTTGHKDAKGEEVFTEFKHVGETIVGLRGFRQRASDCRGSRDTAALLLTALCRALGLEARVVFSLQPLGFGFGAVENASESGRKETPQSDRHRPIGRKKGKKKQKQVSSDLSSLSDGESSGAGGFIKSTSTRKSKPTRPAVDSDLLFPIFWTELVSPATPTPIALSAFPAPLLGASPDVTAKFCPRGAAAQAAKQVICYIISYTSSDTAVDVTTRYLPTRSLPSKTKGFRVPITSVPIYAYSGEEVGHERIDWFGKVLRSFKKPSHLLTPFEQREELDLSIVVVEDETGRNRKKEDSITAYKNHPVFVLARHLKREEALSPDAKVVKTFTVTSKGEKLTETVYRREDVLVCKTSENWYRDGRKIVEGAQPLKFVSRRAVTLARKREIESTKQDSGETPTQGLYALYQTEIYRPPPVGKDDTIPKNEFNNIDLYTPSMLPEGTVHLPLKGAARVAKQLGLEYAEAVTGFEFRKQRANPVIEGVVVRMSDAGLLEDAWRTMEEEKRRKEQARREGRALEMWARWVQKLRVRERLRRMWAEEGREESNPFIAKEREGRPGGGNGNDGALEGRGLLPDDHGEEGGFLPEDHEDEQHSGGGFILDLEEDHTPVTGTTATTAPRSAMSLRELAQQSVPASVLEDEGDEDAADDYEADEEGETSKYFSRPPKTRKRKASPPTTVRATRSSARRRIDR